MARERSIRNTGSQANATEQSKGTLHRESATEAGQPDRTERQIPPYGGLTVLDTSRLILDSVGASLLCDIAEDLLDLLGTRCAVFEKNGDYALSMFASGWCRFMDQASRRRCDAPDNREAMESGKWHCHESCWSAAARRAIEMNGPVDVTCRGGIRLFAVPICVGTEIVGGISVGYGDPPRDPAALNELATLYSVSGEELRRQAEAYGTRPLFMVELAKKRVLSSARMIGEIVARKQAEETLRRREERFRALFDLAKDVIFIYDQEGRILEANREACERLGYSRSEFLNMKPFEIDTPEEAALFPERMATLRRQGHNLFETLHQKRDGTVVPIEVSVRLFESAGRRLSLSVCRDITERKRAEAALRASEEKFRSLVETTSDWVWEVDATGTYTYTSPKVRDLLGYEPEEVVGKTPFDFMPPEERERVAQIFQRAAQSKASLSAIENVNIHKDGRLVSLETSAVPVVDAEGKLLGYRGIDRDITDRKQAQEALRQANLVVENSPVVLFRWGAAEGWPVIMVSQNVRQFGYTQQELLSGEVLFASLVHPEDSDRVAREVREYTASGVDHFRQEYRIVTKDGRVFWVDDRTVVERNPDGRAAFYQGIVIDITENKRAAERLAHSHDLMRYIIEHANSSVAVHDRDMRYIYVSQRYLDEYKIRERDVIGKHHYDVFPDLPQKWRDVHQRALRGEVCGADRDPYYRADGTIDWTRWECRPWYTAGGAIGGIIVYTEVITERVQAEEALLRNEALLSKSQEIGRIGSWELDLATNRLTWSAEAYRIFGLRPQELAPSYEAFLAAVHPEDREAVNAAYSESVREGRDTYEIEHRLVPRDNGEVRFVLEKGEHVKDAAGSIVRSVGMVQDITDRRRMEEERRKIDVQMREVQKLESLGVLAGGIAHDFNNLLMAILGNADLALCSLSPVAPAREHVEEITRASQRAADLCRQMLAYSGKGRFVVDNHDISEIVREMEQILSVSVSKNAMIRYSLAEGLPAVKSDTTQIRQVIMNLITNASDALGDTNGIITVTTGVMECTGSYLSGSYLDESLPGGTYVSLEVSDTGCGMDAETRNRIFDPFFTTKFIGRGLGLAAVLGIVRGHKGAIKVYSEVGQGTTMKILLPAVEREPDKTVKPAEPSIPPQCGGTVLLVDDDPVVRSVASAMLAQLGFQVLTAINGREGLKVFHAHGAEIACVILDLTMPEMGGEETFRELRALQNDVRVIMSSGYNEQDVTQRFVGRGLTGFIQKPYTVASLRSALSSVLG